MDIIIMNTEKLYIIVDMPYYNCAGERERAKLNRKLITLSIWIYREERYVR
jgi:hypothetical protein